jgi:hypothetical protein
MATLAHQLPDFLLDPFRRRPLPDRNLYEADILTALTRR